MMLAGSLFHVVPSRDDSGSGGEADESEAMPSEGEVTLVVVPRKEEDFLMVDKTVIVVRHASDESQTLSVVLAVEDDHPVTGRGN